MHTSASAELRQLPARERAAVRNAVAKLEQLGPSLSYPYSSAVMEADRVRELRPRAGNSPWRVFYRQMGNVFVVGAIGPEAQVKPRLFEKAVTAAVQRLNEMEADS